MAQVLPSRWETRTEVLVPVRFHPGPVLVVAGFWGVNKGVDFCLLPSLAVQNFKIIKLRLGFLQLANCYNKDLPNTGHVFKDLLSASTV